MIPIDAGATAAISKSFSNFAKSASSGAFAVSPEGADPLIRAVQDMRDWIDLELGTLQELAMEPPLGSSEGAQRMRPYLTNVASDGQGFLTMLEKFRDSLVQAEQGLNDAIRNYEGMDKDGAARMQ